MKGGGLDVVIVSYRSRELLRQCLEALRANPPSRPMSVVVVDNASGDGTVEMALREYPEVEVIASAENLGFAAATNLGARRGEFPYLLALNPDTAVTPGALDTAIAVLESHEEVAVVGPRLVRPDGSEDHAGKRSFPTPLSALGHFSGIGRRPEAGGRLAAYRAPDVESGPVDAVNGAFMLMRRAVFESAGGFDEGYWMYMEDLDLSYRLAQEGWLSWYEPAATVAHVKGGTVGGPRPTRLNWHFHRGMYRFYRRHYAPERPAALNAVVYLGIALKFAASAAQSFARRSLARLRHRRRAALAREGGSPSTSGGG
ncbi:MAG TPA: glycosyltransferase family 2 protein [Solirubrobacterales bacterium]|nr:glycosyltransferase family 2 protein [Solirubrobacterales bacterium]